MKMTASSVQKQAIAAAEGYKGLMKEVGSTLWNLGEIGLEEYHSAAYLADIYSKNGFEVKLGIAGFPTGFIAQYSNGDGPVMALLCEYDALPEMSTVEPGKSGHGCGHNLFGAAATGCAMLVKDMMTKNNIKGTLRIYGTPGEENFGSKAYYVNHGLFDDVDCSVGFHASTENKVNYVSAAATLVLGYTFHGMPAHAGNSPWLGRSALDAVEIMNIACNFLREHLRPDTRIHYIITKGGGSPNIVPELAASRYMVRAADVPYMEEVAEKVNNCARAAALATGCTVEIDVMDKLYNTMLLREYAQLAQDCLELVGPPDYTPDELAQGKKFGNGSGMHTGITPLPWQEGYEGGATDEADVSWVVPHTSVYVGNMACGTVGHTLEFTQQANMPAAYTAMVKQVQAVAVMLLELFQSPEKVAELKAAHKAKLGDQSYPKNPNYTLPPKYNPNCQGITVTGNTITADFGQIILLPKDYSGNITLEKAGKPVAVLSGSGSVTASQPLESGDGLYIYCQQGSHKQLLGYYNIA